MLGCTHPYGCDLDMAARMCPFNLMTVWQTENSDLLLLPCILRECLPHIAIQANIKTTNLEM